MKTLKKLLIRAAVTIAAFAIATAPAYAAVDHAVVDSFVSNTPGNLYAVAHFMDGSTEVSTYGITFPIGSGVDEQSLVNNGTSAINSYASGQGYTLSNGIVWPFMTHDQVTALIGVANVHTATTNSLSMSLATTSSSLGTQVSTTTGSWVAVNGSVTTTASILGSSAGDIILQTSPTNTATSTWSEWGRIGNAQSYSLAVAIQGVQTTKGQIMAWVPAGYYLRALQSGSGTVAYSLGVVTDVLQ